MASHFTESKRQSLYPHPYPRACVIWLRFNPLTSFFVTLAFAHSAAEFLVPLLFCCFLFLSRVRLFATPWTAAHQASLSFTVSWSLLRIMSTGSVMPSNHLILCLALLLLPSDFPSIRVFSSESVLCIRWPKDWSVSLPSWSHLILISFCCVLGLCHSFRSYALCLSLLLHLHVVIFPLLLLIFYLF